MSNKKFKVVTVVCALLATSGLVCTRTLALEGLSNTLVLFGVLAVGFVVISSMFFRTLNLKKPSVLEPDTTLNL